MIIGVDIDGCAGDYVGGLRKFLADRLEIPEEDRMTVFPEPIDYNFSTWPGISEDFVEYHAQAVALGLYKEMDAIGNVSEILWRLSNEGHHLRVITSRFVKSGQHSMVIGSTAIWLDKHDIPYRDIMFVRNKTDVYADIYIDDAEYNIEAYRAAGSNFLIFDAPYNKHVEGPRVYNWDEVYEAVKTFELSLPER